MFNELDPLLHSQLRLAIMSILVSIDKAEFKYILEKTDASSGNLSVQLQKLKVAEYITIVKQFKGNYPQTTCKITPKGIKAFEDYVNSIKDYLKLK